MALALSKFVRTGTDIFPITLSMYCEERFSSCWTARESHVRRVWLEVACMWSRAYFVLVHCHLFFFLVAHFTSRLFSLLVFCRCKDATRLRQMIAIHKDYVAFVIFTVFVYVLLSFYA